jgi:hypothetical protein
MKVCSSPIARSLLLTFSLAVVAASLVSCGGPPAKSVPQAAPASPPVAASPAPAASAASGSPQERKGRELIEHAVQAMGGAKTIDGIQSLELKGKAKRIFPGGQDVVFDSRMTILVSGSVRQELDLPFGKLVTVATPAGAFTDIGDGPVLLPDAQREELESSFRRNLIVLLQARSRPDFRATAKGPAAFADGPAEQVEILSRGVEASLAIDAATGRIRAIRHLAVFGQAAGGKENVTKFSDYRTVKGLSYPFTAASTTGGEPSYSMQLETVAINEAVDPSIFEPKGNPVAPDAPAMEPSPSPSPAPTPKG